MPVITINLEENIWKVLKKRAEKCLLEPQNLIEDIVRRSMISYRKTGQATPSGYDDDFIRIFSRERRGRKRKK